MTKAKLLTATAAIALWDEAADRGDAARLEAAEAMAATLRAQLTKAPKKSAKAAVPQLLADLRGAMKVLLKQIDARHTIPILSSVALIAQGDNLVLKGTDLDGMTIIRIDAPDIGNWSTCVNAREFSAVLKTTGDVLMETDEIGRLTVLIGDATSKLAGLPVSDFPDIGFSPGPATRLDIPAGVFAELLAYVAPAISTEETRYYLNGFYFHPARTAPLPERTDRHEKMRDELAALETARNKHETAVAQGSEGQDMPDVILTRTNRIVKLYQACEDLEKIRAKPDALRLVTTDGHRMNVADIPAPESWTGFKGVIVPRKTADILAVCLGSNEETVVKVANEPKGGMGAFRVAVGNITVITKVIDGNFPDYTRVLPKNNDKVLTVVRKDLIDAVTAVASIKKDRTQGVKLDIRDRLRLSAKNMEGGDAHNSVAYTAAAKLERLETGFNAKYLLEALACQDSETVELTFNEASSPAVCRMPDRPDRICVLMPLRL